MYIFELCYRQGISYITWLQCVYSATQKPTSANISHSHACTIMIAQLALAFTTTHRAPDTTIEMVLCLTWGTYLACYAYKSTN